MKNLLLGVVSLVLLAGIVVLSFQGTQSPEQPPSGPENPGMQSRDKSITVGSKHFTEQKILGEMIALLIERNTDIRVERKLGLQGTKVVFDAVRTGEIDLYPEYTGTGLINLLNLKYKPEMTRDQVMKTVTEQFNEKWNLKWMGPMGFANTYAFAMRSAHARELGIVKVSDLKDHVADLKPGFDHEFTDRPEYKQFPELYGFEFSNVKKIAPDIMYKAIKEKEVDIIDAFSTDGRISAYELTVLEDDKGLFPPYDCAIVVRENTLTKYPELQTQLEKLNGLISAADMQSMNYTVTDKNITAKEVAETFLTNTKLIEK